MGQQYSGRGQVHATHHCCGDHVFWTCHKTAVTTTQSPHCSRLQTYLHVSRTPHRKPRLSMNLCSLVKPWHTKKKRIRFKNLFKNRHCEQQNSIKYSVIVWNVLSLVFIFGNVIWIIIYTRCESPSVCVCVARGCKWAPLKPTPHDWWADLWPQFIWWQKLLLVHRSIN